MEPDDKYGYASINSLSKALFNLSYTKQSNFFDLIQKNIIAILAYVQKEDLIKDIINKTNNIPLNFNLYLFISNNVSLYEIKQYIQMNSKANKFKVETSFNYIIDILNKFKYEFKKYKYICNINYNLYKNISYFEEWKNYIHNNLLGNSTIISEILTDFENNNNLGLIFPERYYKSLYKFGDNINDLDLAYLNIILSKINPKFHILKGIIDFPEGNMFWAKSNAIYKIFRLDKHIFNSRKLLLLLENNLDKIWIYLVGIDGYLYKTIFKSLS